MESKYSEIVEVLVLILLTKILNLKIFKAFGF